MARQETVTNECVLAGRGLDSIPGNVRNATIIEASHELGAVVRQV